MIDVLPAERRSWFLIFGVIAFGISTVLSITIEFRASSLKNELHALQSQKNALIAAPALGETSQTAETAAKALLVKKELAAIESHQLPWSKIIEKIEAAIPKTEGSNKPIVEFRSYTGSEDGRISVSAVTQPDSTDPFVDVSRLLESFSTELAFKKVFVPSLTKSLTPAGETVVSFSLNFEYHNLNLIP